MSNRPIIYSEEQGRTFDILWGWRDAMIALSQMEQDITGSVATQFGGFVASATGPASLTINLGAGRIYQQAAVDSTSYGAIASDSDIIQQQGAAGAQQVTFTTSALSAGQSQWALVEAQFSQVDQIAVGDPTGGLLLYYNSANPAQPLQGPGNNGQIQPTTRLGTVAIKVIYGAPATTGSEVPPQPETGWAPMYLVDLTFGQTSIISNQILVAGPSVGSNVPSNYPGAPFVAGLLSQHHKGIAGQAPQIDLTSEVKNVLPLSNIPASNTAGGVAVFKQGSGNPNGNVAGNSNVNGANDLYWDNTNLILYTCTATGTTSTAVWTSVVGSSTSQFAGGTSTGTANAQVISSTTPSGFSRTPGQVVTFTVGVGLTNTNATTLNVSSTGAAAINKNTGSGNVPLAGGELVAGQFVSVIWTGSVYLLQSGTLGALATLNIGTWLKNDGSGNLTIKNGTTLGDDGSGNFVVLPQYLPPVGSLAPYAGTSAPFSNWAICNGQAVSRTTYAVLFAILGITFGGGDGITTFNLPDLRGRVVAGVDGGVNRLTTTTMSSQALGGTGGFETQTLTLSQIPTGITSTGSLSGATTQSVILGGTSGGGGVGGGGNFGLAGTPGVSVSGTLTSNNTGGGAHPNVQPTMELNYLIRLA